MTVRENGRVREQTIEVEEESSWVNWQSALYFLVLGGICVFLAPVTSLWWIVPILGVAWPIVMAMLDRSFFDGKELDERKDREGELLEVLARWNETTPATVAMHTSLTLDDASEMLDELAGKGYLKLRAQDGVVAYSLPGRDTSFTPNGAVEFNRLTPEVNSPVSNEQLDDPLSERELEVLVLLASGKTNAEIATDLFVALGTVKSHINNIYRKLGARNRAEAVSRARELNLMN